MKHNNSSFWSTLSALALLSTACNGPSSEEPTLSSSGGRGAGDAEGAQLADLSDALATLERRAQRLEDHRQIERLQRIYGYYVDRADWDNVLDLMTDDATAEYGSTGVFAGKSRIRELLYAFGGGRKGLRRVMTLGGTYGGDGVVGGGVYENECVKEDGVWKIKTDHLYTTFTADYLLGWAKGWRPIAGPSETLPPDRPPTEVYEAFPAFHTLPFHYNNPVTGLPPERK